SVFLTGTATALVEAMDAEGAVAEAVGQNGSSEAAAAATVSSGARPNAGAAGVAALEVRDVSVSFGGVRALDHVDLRVEQGEIVGLIGPNGAGKTTLLNVVSGLIPADGDVLLLGDDLTGRSSSARALRGLGRSFQDSRLFPSLTVEEVLLVALERWLAIRDPLNAAFRMPPFVDS
ncbi:ATP-binding cassette domain-containing protein, partial [bacterium]|nr:ATP-binding cassette domain-containing protein [bacterium]